MSGRGIWTVVAPISAVILLLVSGVATAAESTHVVMKWTAPYKGPGVATTRPIVTYACATTTQTPISISLSTGIFGYAGTGRAHTCPKSVDPNSSYLLRGDAGMALGSFTGLTGKFEIQAKFALDYILTASLTGSSSCGDLARADSVVVTGVELTNVSTGTTLNVDVFPTSIYFEDGSRGSLSLKEHSTVFLNGTEHLVGTDTYELEADVSVNVGGLVANNASLSCVAKSSVSPGSSGKLCTLEWMRILDPT